MTNYEMALSEIEAYKKAHESLSENLTHANKKAQKFKMERDTLIDDLKVLRTKNEKLEQVSDIKDESQEIYRKAKAFDEIKKIFNDYFEYYGCYPSPKEYAKEVINVIDGYKDCADETEYKKVKYKNDSVSKCIDRLDDDNIMG